MNTQINVDVQGEIRFPDLLALAQAIAGKAITAAPAVANAPAPAVANVPAPAPVAPIAPVTPTVTAAPVSAPATASVPATAPVPAPAIPTSTPKYSIDDIARAGAMLAQQGPEKLAALNGLLQQFGLQSLTQLPQEQTAAFVQAMRGLGAQI